MPLLPSIPSLRPKPLYNDRLETKGQEETNKQRIQEKEIARQRHEKECAEKTSQEQEQIRKAAEEDQRLRKMAAEEKIAAQKAQTNKKQETPTSKDPVTKQEMPTPQNEKTIRETTTKHTPHPPLRNETKHHKTINPENLKTKDEARNAKPARHDKELPSIPYDPVLREKYGIFYD